MPAKRRSFDVAAVLGQTPEAAYSPGRMGRALAAAVAPRSADSRPPPSEPVLAGGDLLMDIPLDQLVEHPMQRHRPIDESDVDDMVRSIEAAGGRLVERIVVRPLEGTPQRFEIVSGHRRTRAARRMGWATIEAIARFAEHTAAKRAHLLANEARRDLTDWERARHYHAALHEEPVTASHQRELAALVGKSEASVSRCLSMLQLPAPVLALLDREPNLLSSTLAVEAVSLARQGPAAEAAEALFENYGTDRYRKDPIALRSAVAAILSRSKSKAPKVRTGRIIVAGPDGKPDLLLMTNAREIKIRPVRGMPLEYLTAGVREAVLALAEKWRTEAPTAPTKQESAKKSKQ